MLKELFQLDVKTVQSFIVLTSLCFLVILLFVGADLVSGIMRSRRNKIPLSSKAFRLTLSKIVEYFCALIVFSIIGTIVQYSCELSDIHLPRIPYFSFLLTIAIGLIEFKSIIENMQAKTKKNVRALLAAIKMLDLKEKENILKALAEYITEDNSEE